MMATPYELLLGMSLLREQQAQRQTQPRNNHAAPHVLAGSAFLQIRLAQQRFLVVQDVIKEIMPLLKIAEVTPTQSWLFGFASYKGELLPVIDMQRLPKFLSFDTAAHTALATQDYPLVNHESYRQAQMDNARILVLESAEGLLGLYVDAVLGIQHYWLAAESDGQTNTWHQAWVKIDDKTDDKTQDKQTDQSSNSTCLPVLNIQKIIQYCHLARH
ncbi:MAG: chemotaxis protein CheW [bacterium]